MTLDANKPHLLNHIQRIIVVGFLSLVVLLTWTPGISYGRQPSQRNFCNWSDRSINTTRLPQLMKEMGFKPPARFRALLVRVELDRKANLISKMNLYAYGTSATRVDGWNPASTIKLYAAVSALERLNELGYGPKTTVTFHYPRGDKKISLQKLLEEDLHKSDNIAHNRMVQLAGFDYLNGPRGTLRRAGMRDSAILRAYAQSQWEAEGNSKILRASPRITLQQPKSGRYSAKKNVLPESTGTAKVKCQSAACTSLSDLGKMMCHLMLHEQLPQRHRLKLGTGPNQSPMLAFFRQRLNRVRDANDGVWLALERHLIPKSQRGQPSKGSYQLFRKAGFSQDWLSDNIYVYQPHSKVRWIVVMAAYPGRKSLDQAADIIARIIKDDLVLKSPKKRTNSPKKAQ